MVPNRAMRKKGEVQKFIPPFREKLIRQWSESREEERRKVPSGIILAVGKKTIAYLLTGGRKILVV